MPSKPARSRKKTIEQQPALRIEGELTIFRALELKQAMLAAPAPNDIDLSGVTDIDSAGLQLLMLARKTAQAEQRKLRLLAPSAAVLEVFELLNVAAFFADPPQVATPSVATEQGPTSPTCASC